MKRQKIIIISVVCSILIVAILGTIVAFNDKVSAAACNHKWESWKNTGVGVHVRSCTECSASESQDCDDYSSWVSYGVDGHHWECSVCSSITMPREHTYSNGKCTECNYVCTHKTLEWKNNEIEHWQVCKGCAGEVKNTRGTHKINKWVDNNNNTHSGICTICEAKIDEAHEYKNEICKCGSKKTVEEPKICEHNEVEWKNSATEHWQECKNCLSEIAGKRKNHSYENGKCTICNYSCNHTERKWLAISTEHWQVCKICEQEIIGTRANHLFKKGKCTECNYNCKHKVLEWKNNETEHWQICKNCLMEIDGTRGNHLYEDKKCTKCEIAEKEQNNSENNNQPNDSQGNTSGEDNKNTNNITDNFNNTTNNDNKNNDMTKKDYKIPNTGLDFENTRIVFMVVGAVLGCALLIRLSRKED